MKTSWNAFLLATGLVMGGTAFAAHAQSPTQTAKPETALQQIDDIEERLATIKSAKDLNAYMAQTSAADSPFMP